MQPSIAAATRRTLTGRAFLAAVAGVLLTLPAAAQDFIFGVGTHFAFPPSRGYLPASQRPLLAELGVDSIRDDVHEGIYGPSEPGHPLGRRMGRLNEVLLERKAKPVLILVGRQLPNKPPLGSSAPTNPRETEAFAQFGARVVEGTRALDPIYEIWNEWNMRWRPDRSMFGRLGLGREDPDYSPENYVTVARASYEAIKRANPAALVLTGSIGDDDGWTWSRRALIAGMARTGDGISLHLYNHCNPPAQRTAEDMIGKAESFQRLLREEAGVNPPPVYLTEVGWPTDDGPCGIPPNLAGANLAQMALWAPTTNWIKGLWAYELRDSGQNKAEREDNFGLYDYANRPKPVACLYREAIRLSRALSTARFRDAPAGVRWLEGTARDGSTVWVIWTTGRDAKGMIRGHEGAPLEGSALCAPVGAVAEIGPIPTVFRPGAGAAAPVIRLD